jgi:DHA2 family metal-tetracycline-proton antiporter-like MFS transporter
MEAAVRQPSGAKLLRILAFTTSISVMSATMFNIALPVIAAEFGLSLSQVSWVSSAYLLRTGSSCSRSVR